MIRVAIDGPAGVGKSSTSKALAKYYGFAYLDTGAMYRACAWWCMHKGIDLDAETIDEQLVTETVGEFFTDGHFDISVDPDDPKVYADDEDISEAIRSSEVSSHVSKVSNIIPVRHVLIAAQRAYIAREASVDSFSEGAGIVAEGRDITTVVAPDAEVRILLTAREEVRQARRSGQAVIDGTAFSGGESKNGPKPVGVLAVVGRPNVGKSTLVNRILGRRAAVVEDTPGVTRDRVSYDAEWCGTDFKLVDTGGWEADVEGIESAIASQAQIAVQLADAVILVVDGLVGLTDTDERIVKMLRAAGKPVTLAVNKVDDRESEYLTAEFWKMGLGEPYGISAMHGRGIGELLDAALDSLKKAERTSGFLTPSHLRRVALVGRPNVGKSSLLNQLAHEERTVVNDLAGTTRDPVDEVVTVDGEDWLFIDTAGIKRRLHKLSGAEYFSSLRTQAAIERSELALVLFDASQPISDQDLKVMSQAVDAGRCIVLVFNKWDLMDEFDRQRMERLWKTEFNRVTWAQRVNLSAKTGWHTNRLANAMRGALASWDKRIPTGKLNAFLGKIQAAHPHPLRGGKQPRILFATQASTRPPRFVIFATGFLEHGYRRYIERCLREEFGFEGSPIQISVNVREKKKRK